MKVRIASIPTDKAKVRILGLPKRQAGGSMPTTKGLPPSLHHMANVEAEAGEVYQDQDGGFNKIDDQAKSHEQGGVMIPDAERVLEDTSTDRKDKFSKTLKMSPNEVNTIFGFKPKSPVSHAKAFELANNEYDKQRKKFNVAQKDIDEAPNQDNMSMNSAKLNFANREFVPDQQDVFDTLFEHQEAIKAVHGIPNDGQAKKYGGYRLPKAQAGGISTYEGGKTPEGSTTPTGNSNKFKYDGGLDAFKKAWSPILDLNKYNSVEDAQGATYDWLVKNQPDVAASIWKEQGLTAKGRRLMDPKSKDYDPNFTKVAKNVFDASGKLKDGVNLDKDTLAAISPAYQDKMLGIRSVTPSQTTQTDTPAQPAAPAPAGAPGMPTKQPSVNVNPRLTPETRNRFYEPTHWYDLAPGVAELADSMTRDPELYNPVQLHQLKYKMLNPTAALNANQADYNAAADELGNDNVGSGAAAANLSNLTAQKYKANGQIIGEYENQNVGIQNKEIDYNTNVRDRQSMADANSREQFYDKVLRSRDNQRLQKLQAIQDLSRVQQLKARQNNSGNLILKMSPAFDQNGEYNGYQYHPTLPDGSEGFVPQPATKAGKPTSRTTTTFKVGDKTVRTTNSQ